jgi:hypothetical protein
VLLPHYLRRMTTEKPIEGGVIGVVIEGTTVELLIMGS